MPRWGLGDVYPHADLVTYPSSTEGFGNAFLEAVYYRRPLVVNSYPVYTFDIRPKGFRAIEFDDYLTDCTVRQARAVVDDPALAAEMADANYAVAQRHFSFAVLERRLQTLIADLFGEG
jgi:glycosyltransferase involved in cell wall biosynthesis